MLVSFLYRVLMVQYCTITYSIVVVVVVSIFFVFSIIDANTCIVFRVHDVMETVYFFLSENEWS